MGHSALKGLYIAIRMTPDAFFPVIRLSLGCGLWVATTHYRQGGSFQGGGAFCGLAGKQRDLDLG